MKKVSFTIVLLIMGLINIIAQNAPKSGPCPGMPQFTDPRDGKMYNTVQIGDRCWMKENLNVGTFINGAVNQTNNQTIEKYCYSNSESNCTTYGGLYLWSEMMQYSTTPGIQGICADGWRIPTDGEWCAAATALDATVDCNFIGFSGTNAGGLLKEAGTTHWNTPNTGATNGSEFTGLPGGFYSSVYQAFDFLGCVGYFHTSSSNGPGRWTWLLNAGDARINRISFEPTAAFSVRCIRDANWTAQLSVTPLNQDVTTSAGTTTFDVTSNTSWTVAESVSWFTVSPENSSNNGTLTVTYDANSSPDPRNGQITITSGDGAPVINVSVNQAGNPWVCGMPITDTRDSKTYTTVQIGTQCWMKQNLNIGTRIAGTSEQTNNGIIEKYCYSNLETNCDVYGGLYQWNEMMQYSTTPGVQGICPTGWHLPTDAEWCTVTTFLDATVNCSTYGWSGTNAGGKMKETGTTHWLSPNTGATNSSGFTGLPGGLRDTGGSFITLLTHGFWWSSTQRDASVPWGRALKYNEASVYKTSNYYGGAYGFSVRCLKD